MVHIRQTPSANYGPRKNNKICNSVVLHYTDMETTKAALDHMCNPQSEVSAHYLISETGDIYQLVEEDKRAWHAGVSYWNGETDINSCSIGIELANRGHSHMKTEGLAPFPSAQIASLIQLLKPIMDIYHIPASRLLAHSDIAPGRKIDPGPRFPWAYLAENDLGYFPYLNKVTPMMGRPIISQEMMEPDATQMLHQIGYQTEEIDQTIRAFQLRYRPKSITGILDSETVSLIKTVYEHHISP